MHSEVGAREPLNCRRRLYDVDASARVFLFEAAVKKQDGAFCNGFSGAPSRNVESPRLQSAAARAMDSRRDDDGGGALLPCLAAAARLASAQIVESRILAASE